VVVAVASLGVAAPVVLALALGERAAAPLEGMRVWLVRNGAVVMSVVLLVIGVTLIGDALAGG
jgi:cytochrome c biogenesis protein CcdA